MSTVSIVVFAYNEEANLATVVREISDELAGLGVDYEILIIDDGSTDSTGTIADELADLLQGLRVVHHPENMGLGGAYRTGFREATGDFISFFPADGQFPATIIGQFLPRMAENDLVLGYLPRRDSSLLAKTLSRAERVLYHLLFGHFPRFQGILMFRREILDAYQLVSTGRGWAVLMELILRASRGGERIVSVETEMRPRLSGESKVNNFRTIWSNLEQVFLLSRQLKGRTRN